MKSSTSVLGDRLPRDPQGCSLVLGGSLFQFLCARGPAGFGTPCYHREMLLGHRRTWHRRLRMRLMLAVLLSVNLVGCVELVVHQPATPPGGRYVCEDGKLFLVELSGDGATAAVTFDNRTVTLQHALGGADAKYSDGRTTLHLDGPRALLETSGLVFARGCVQR